MMLLLSYASDGVAEATLAVASCRCRVMSMMALASLAGYVAAKMTLVISLSSLADDGIIEVMLAMAQYHY
jgi:hypothetical protein